MMKKYRKVIDGKTVIKPHNKIVVVKDKRQYIAPRHEILIEDGWELYEENEVELAKRSKIAEIKAYDASNNVNLFYIGEQAVWLDKATRVGLMPRFKAEKAAGNEQTVVWYNNMPFQLVLSNAIQMLYAVELYASKCYDITQSHISNVNALNDIEAIKNYDYTVGYPTKLEF